MRRNLSVLIFVTLALVGNLAAQSKPEAPEYEHQGTLHKIRIQNSDARRRASFHLHLCS